MTSMEDQLPYRIRDDCYTFGEESEIDPYYEAVVACAEGNLNPLDAAERITAVLADQALQSKEDIDLHQKNQPYVVNTDLVAVVIGSASSSFAPSSLAHERLLQLLQSFTSVKPRQVPNSNLDQNLEIRPALKDFGHLIDTRPQITLWENLDKLHFAENFKTLAEIGQTHWTGVEKCGSEEQQRWRNLNFFFAKLTTSGIADLSYLSALFMLLPEMQIKPTTPGWSGFLAGQALAAAQWIIPEIHGAWVWHACQRTVKLDAEERPPRRKWNLEYWAMWKSRFQEVVERVEDERIHNVALKEAKKALEIMMKLEGRYLDKQQ